MFEANSANSVSDLFVQLSEDASPPMLSLLRDLAEELEKQDYLAGVGGLFCVVAYCVSC